MEVQLGVTQLTSLLLYLSEAGALELDAASPATSMNLLTRFLK